MTDDSDLSRSRQLIVLRRTEKLARPIAFIRAISAINSNGYSINPFGSPLNYSFAKICSNQGELESSRRRTGANLTHISLHLQFTRSESMQNSFQSRDNQNEHSSSRPPVMRGKTAYGSFRQNICDRPKYCHKKQVPNRHGADFSQLAVAAVFAKTTAH